MKESILKKIWLRLLRNHYDCRGQKFVDKQVNLIYWRKKVNLGDTLAPIICEWVLAREGICMEQMVSRTQRLMTVGSILDLGRHDATVWGSGILSFHAVTSVKKRSYRKFDIRAIRGPVTREALLECGYDCPAVYGDPGILLPLICPVDSEKKKVYDTAVILHHSIKENEIDPSIKKINIQTSDYKLFVDEITSAKKIISSSLHGIILAESYGIPAVFLCENMEKEMLKFYDWYFSTGRYNIRLARSLEEALRMEPMELPELAQMQETLLSVFPYDLWK